MIILVSMLAARISASLLKLAINSNIVDNGQYILIDLAVFCINSHLLLTMLVVFV